MNKPPLTQQQREKFEQEFRTLMTKAPEELQSKWNGIIQWMPVIDAPIIDQTIISKLPPALADRYASLLNKIKGRNI